MIRNEDLRLKEYLTQRKALVEKVLDTLLPGEELFPPVIFQASRYSLMAGGKRLRPILCMAAVEAVGGKIEAVMPAACALELIHTYSLIHDDLPAMDNDDFRRGKPTSHKLFGEAIAILAGDALLTEAFHMLARRDLMPGIPPERILAVGCEIAEAAGWFGMVAGQVLDIRSEGQTLALETLEQLHRLQAGRRRHVRRAPETPHARDGLGREIHVRRELVRQSAHLAPAHRVGLAGDRERPHALAPDAPRGQVAVDDRVALVGAGARLVDALRVEGDGALRRREPVAEGLQRVRRDAKRLARAPQVPCARRRECGVQTLGVRGHVRVRDAAARLQVRQQRGKQQRIAAGADREVQVVWFEDAARHCTAVMVNYASHPVNLYAKATVSADFPGVLRKSLQSVLGDAVPVVYVQGACGNIHPCGPQNPSFQDAGLTGISCFSRRKPMDCP